MDVEFEDAFSRLVEEQHRTARGQRKEQLERDLTGTKQLLEEVIWPVLGSFEGIILEYEITGANGERNYIDVYYEPLGIGFECEGFVTHAETITRRRFSYERRRVRKIAAHRYVYYPFSKDELDKEPDVCRRDLRELLTVHASPAGSRAMKELSVYEREVLRYGLLLPRPLRLEDVKFCLGKEHEFCRKVVRSLLAKKLLAPVKSGKLRNHGYIVLPRAREYLLK